MAKMSVMRKAISLMTVALAAAALNGSVHAADTGDVKNIAVIDTLEPNGPFDKIWEPHLAKWKKNHYVACYGRQGRGKPDMGDMICSITKDGGKTWSPRIPVFNHQHRNGSVQYAYNNAVLFRPEGQDIIWLFVMRAPLHYKNSENADIVAAYTADGGMSWHHVEVAMDYQSPLIIVAGLQTVERNGVTTYLLPAHRNTRRADPHGDRRQFVLESTSLLHWKLANYVDYPEDDPLFLHEGKIAPNDEGEGLKIVMRTATMDRERPLESGLAWSSVSTDQGKTWSIAKPEPELPNFRSKAFFGQDTNGKHIYVYCDHFDRKGLFYKTKSKGGDWSNAKKFYDAGNRNSYPTLIEDKPGEWLAVWDSSNDPDQKRTAIRFGKLKVE